MKQNLLERTKEYLSSIKSSEMKELHEYFKNSSDFILHNEKRGLEIISNSDNVHIDGERDERNTYSEYIANDRSFIVRVDKYGIREGMIKLGGVPFLEWIGSVEDKIPVYRVSCK